MSYRSSDLESVGEFGPGRKLPDKNKDPKAWNEVRDRADRNPYRQIFTDSNKTWNRYLEWAFNPGRKLEPQAINHWSMMFEMHDNPVTRQQHLTASRDGYSALLRLQNLIHELMKKSRDAFAVEWLSKSPQRRLDHILGGLVRFCQETDHELWRMFVPESTNSFLERDCGRGFLDLLTTFSPPDQPTLGREKPILLSHPRVNTVMHFNEPCPAGKDPAVWDLIRGDNDCTRSDFLCNMLIHTIADTRGMELPQPQLRKADTGWRARREWYSELPSSMGDFKKEALAAGKARWKAAIWRCTSCGRPEADLPQGTPFAFCVPCRGINRKVPYCNKLVQHSP